MLQCSAALEPIPSMHLSTKICLIAFASAILTIALFDVLGLSGETWMNTGWVLLSTELTISVAAFAWCFLLQLYLIINTLLDALLPPLLWLGQLVQRRKK
jgi:hypothetical protein